VAFKLYGLPSKSHVSVFSDPVLGVFLDARKNFRDTLAKNVFTFQAGKLFETIVDLLEDAVAGFSFGVEHDSVIGKPFRHVAEKRAELFFTPDESVSYYSNFRTLDEIPSVSISDKGYKRSDLAETNDEKGGRPYAGLLSPLRVIFNALRQGTE
jgi:hypothetical protein